MRSLLFLTQAVSILGSSVSDPDFGTLAAFIRCECVQDLDAHRPDLYPILRNGGMMYALYEWFELDESTFIEKARGPAEAAHATIMRDELVKPLLQSKFDALARRGLSPDNATTELLKKYYKSLKSKSELLQIAKEEEDD